MSVHISKPYRTSPVLVVVLWLHYILVAELIVMFWCELRYHYIWKVAIVQLSDMYHIYGRWEMVSQLICITYMGSGNVESADMYHIYGRWEMVSHIYGRWGILRQLACITYMGCGGWWVSWHVSHIWDVGMLSKLTCITCVGGGNVKSVDKSHIHLHKLNVYTYSLFLHAHS